MSTVSVPLTLITQLQADMVALAACVTPPTPVQYGPVKVLGVTASPTPFGMKAPYTVTVEPLSATGAVGAPVDLVVANDPATLSPPIVIGSVYGFAYTPGDARGGTITNVVKYQLVYTPG